ncbi:MAG: hypothetical protein HYV46_22035, partial [candidate division NC10 bacterium]|nr:hypothetical protein [candidate division NC10 bacterium]
MRNLKPNLLELVRRTSAELPDDVVNTIVSAAAQEQEGSNAQYAMNIIQSNIDM